MRPVPQALLVESRGVGPRDDQRLVPNRRVSRQVVLRASRRRGPAARTARSARPVVRPLRDRRIVRAATSRAPMIVGPRAATTSPGPIVRRRIDLVQTSHGPIGRARMIVGLRRVRTSRVVMTVGPHRAPMIAGPRAATTSPDPIARRRIDLVQTSHGPIGRAPMIAGLRRVRTSRAPMTVVRPHVRTSPAPIDRARMIVVRRVVRRVPAVRTRGEPIHVDLTHAAPTPTGPIPVVQIAMAPTAPVTRTCLMRFGPTNLMSA